MKSSCLLIIISIPARVTTSNIIIIFVKDKESAFSPSVHMMTGLGNKHTSGYCSYLDGHWQAEEMDWQESQEVQGRKKILEWNNPYSRTERWLARQKLCVKELGIPLYKLCMRKDKRSSWTSWIVLATVLAIGSW